MLFKYVRRPQLQTTHELHTKGPKGTFLRCILRSLRMQHVCDTSIQGIHADQDVLRGKKSFQNQRVLLWMKFSSGMECFDDFDGLVIRDDISFLGFMMSVPEVSLT